MDYLQRIIKTGWRKSVVAILGGFVTAAGVVMLVTPGPGLLTIAAGLAILGTEYHWARRILAAVKERVRRGGRGSDEPRG